MNQRRRRAFWILCGAMGLVAIALSTVATAVPLYAVTLGADTVTVGPLVALPNVFPVLLALLAGRLVDRMGAMRWLLIGSFGMMSAPLLVVAVGGFAPLLVAQLLTLLAGVGTGVGMPLSIVTVASHVDRRQRGLALGLRLSLNCASRARSAGAPDRPSMAPWRGSAERARDPSDHPVRWRRRCGAGRLVAALP